MKSCFFVSGNSAQTAWRTESGPPFSGLLSEPDLYKRAENQKMTRKPVEICEKISVKAF